MGHLPRQKSKIVCTIGPASDRVTVLEAMLRAGMDVARINLAHGSIPEHAQRIQRIRSASARIGKRVAILADLPGPKIRIGALPQPLQLKKGQRLRLGAGPYHEEQGQAYLPLELPELARPLRKGDDVFLADGFLHLRVETEEQGILHCRVVVGGELRSHKGVNLPGLLLAGTALTPHDQDLLRAILPLEVDGISVSFVESAAELEQARRIAAQQGQEPFSGGQDRASARPPQSARNPRGLRWDYGGARRSGGGDPDPEHCPTAERTHSPCPRCRQGSHHRHTDAGVDGQQPPSHPRRGERRRQRHPRWQRRRDALGGVGHGQLSARKRAHDGAHRCRHRRLGLQRPRAQLSKE